MAVNDLSLALHSFAFEGNAKAKQSKAKAAGVDNSAETDTQFYLLMQLYRLDSQWESVKKHGLRALNRRYGRAATTTALQAMVEETRDGLKADNPFALLWAVTVDRSRR